jgi:hypothetical protein
VPEFDTRRPHIARIYDYWLGGKDNFDADRKAGDQALAADPNLVQGVRGHRAFLGRTVRYLAAEAGIRQFLDIGTGIPTANNTHEVAQRVTPQARVVYVDNDPVVLTHARALLTSSTGHTAYVDADLRDTGKILDAAADTLDFGEPVAVMLIGIMHCIPDSDDPYGIAAKLMEAVPSGSYLTLCQPAIDIEPEKAAGIERILTRQMGQKVTFRRHHEVSRFFSGLDLVEPGVVRIPEWRPGSDLEAANPATVWGGIGRKR